MTLNFRRCNEALVFRDTVVGAQWLYNRNPGPDVPHGQERPEQVPALSPDRLGVT